MSQIKTTVYLDSADYARLKAIASQRGKPAAELVREAVALYAAGHGSARLASSVGAGNSGRKTLSQRDEQLLRGFGQRKR